MKNFTKLITIICFPLLFPIKEAKAVELGPLSVSIGFCQEIQKISSIVNATTIVQWPVAGSPGITAGLLQSTSVVLDFCQFLINLESMKTQNAIFYAANFGNELTGKKWDAHLQQASRTWDIANTVYDFDSGQGRKGAFESASTYRQLSQYVNDSKVWHSRTFNGTEADVRTRAQRERDMQKLAGAAYRRAILKDMINCPVPQDNKDYQRIYNESIAGKEKERAEFEEDFGFFKERLFLMGPRFLENETMLNEYITGLQELESIGATYKVIPMSAGSTSTRPHPTQKGPDGFPVQETYKVTKNFQKFEVTIQKEMFSRFKEKYTARWQSYVTAQIVSAGTSGLLNNPRARIENEFRDLSYQCSNRKMRRNLDPNQGDYEFKIKENTEKCKEEAIKNMVNNETELNNLFEYFLKQFENNLVNMKNRNASIWTVESELLGRSRVIVPGETKPDSFQETAVKCSETLTPAEMERLSLKMQEVNLDLNEQIAQSVLMRNEMEKEQAKEIAKMQEDQRRRNEQNEKRVRENRNQDAQAPGILPRKGGFGR